MEKLKRKKQPKINNIVKNSILKIVVFSVIVALNWAGLSAVGRTVAYYLDNEDSNDNLFQAAIFDFSVTNRHIEDFIGMEALSEIEFASVVTKKTGSLNIQYEVNAEKIIGDNVFCDALKMEVKHNGVEKHDGSLLSFSASATTELGTWEFELDLPTSATNVPHGAECNVDLVFKGWRSDVATFEESGFTDEEKIELRLTSRMIVLNEFLPNPEGEAYGYDFGDDNGAMPQGEWVELYNNSDVSHDLAGWYIWDDSGDSANKIEITAANTVPPSTVIGGHDWLVVYMNKEVFDNDGETVKLFNQNDKLIDLHTYTGNDYCEIEPTPGEGNTSDTDGSCEGVPPNKSYARIPDGIGYWVDPIPTPGKPNKIDEQSVEPENDLSETNVIDPASPSEQETISEPEIESEELVEETIIIIDGLFIGSSVVDLQIEEEPAIEEPEQTEGLPAEVPPSGTEEGANLLEEESVSELEPEPEPIIEEQPAAEEETIIEEEPINEEEQVIEEQPVDEIQPVDEQPVIEEQPVVEEQAVIAPNSGGENSDNEDSGYDAGVNIETGGSAEAEE